MKRNMRWFVSVLSGSSVVAALGLSQTLAVGALSILPLGPQALASGIIAAFVTATLGTVSCALLSRTPGEICGPRTSISVIYAALCADLVMRAGPGVSIGEVIAGLSLAVVLMGLMQIVAGWTRVGEAVKFLPYPINAGFVSGVGMLIVWSQLGPLIGLEGQLASYDWGALLENAKPWAFVVGLAVLIVVWIIPRFSKRIQPLLLGLVAGTALYHGLTLFMDKSALGPTVGALSLWAGAENNLTMAWSRIDLDWMLETSLQVLPYSGFLAIQGIMNSALASVTVADITGVRPQLNRAIFAQGAANVLCGLLAALPIGPSPSQAVVAAKMRDINSAVPVISPIVLLVAVLVLGPVLAQVPIVVLAGLLITAGIGLIDGWTKQLVARFVRGGDADQEIKWNLVIVLAVAGTFFFGNVPLALIVGTVLATILLLVELSSITQRSLYADLPLASRRVWPVDQQAQLERARSAIRVFRPRGAVFFATADQLSGQLAALNEGVRFCVIDCSRLTVIDLTGCRIISSGAKKLAERGITTVLAGLDPESTRDKVLVELGLNTPSPKDRWFRDLDHALEWVESELLRTHSPDVAADKPVAVEDAQIAQGLSPREMDALRPHLLETRLDAGEILFKRGEPGSSIYIIHSGLIEIRIDAEQAPGGWRRMAVLGPGCIFGEVAMLTGGHRSADAVCTKAAQLFKLSQASLLELSKQFPGIHSRILENLNRHLATRLIAATEIAREQ